MQKQKEPKKSRIIYLFIRNKMAEVALAAFVFFGIYALGTLGDIFGLLINVPTISDGTFWNTWMIGLLNLIWMLLFGMFGIMAILAIWQFIKWNWDYAKDKAYEELK